MRNSGESPDAAFWRRVDKSGECWVWLGARLPKGYGQFRHRALKDLAHRMSYRLTHGAIPLGMLVCHRCDNPPCVNPAHLFLGDYRTNSADMDAKGRRVTNAVKGESHPSSKLTAVDVRRIRELRGVIPQRRLAREYGVVRSTIAVIHCGLGWKHVEAQR